MLNATNYRVADPDTTDRYEDVTVFLQEIFNDGHYRLYMLLDSRRANFYIGVGPDSLQELYYKEFERNGIVSTSYTFRDQLSSMFADTLKEHTDRGGLIGRLQFNSADLADALTKLTGKTIKKTKQKYPWQLFVGAAAAVNRLKVTGDPRTYNEIGSYNSQVTPIEEVGVKLHSQRNMGRFFIMARLSYSQFQNARIFDNGYYTSVTTFKASVISIPVSAGYQVFTRNGFSLEPSLGIYAAFLSNNNQTQVPSSGNPMKFANGGDAAIAPFGELALTLKKRLSVVGGYYFPFSIVTAGLYTVSHSSFTFGLRLIL